MRDIDAGATRDGDPKVFTPGSLRVGPSVMTGLPASLLGLSLLFSFQGLTSPLPLGGARPVIDLSETHKDPLSEWVQGRLSAVSESYPGRTTSVVNSLPVINRAIISLRPKGSSSEPKFLLQYGSFYRLFAAVRLFLPALGPNLSVGGVPRLCRIAWFCEHRSRGSRQRPREILAQGECTSSARKDLGASMRGDEPDVATLADLKNFAR